MLQDALAARDLNWSHTSENLGVMLPRLPAQSCVIHASVHEDTVQCKAAKEHHVVDSAMPNAEASEFSSALGPAGRRRRGNRCALGETR